MSAVPASSEIVRKVQTVSNSETQSILQEQLDVMREQLGRDQGHAEPAAGDVRNL